MHFRIHFRHRDGAKDSLDIQGEDLSILRETVTRELARRNIDAETAWSEELL